MTRADTTARRRRFRLWPRARREDGNATSEFVILFPMFVFILVSATEIGFITLRHTMLERAVQGLRAPAPDDR